MSNFNSTHNVSKVLCRLLTLMTRFRHPNFSVIMGFGQILCIIFYQKLFRLISFPFVWERETLKAVHSTHDYGFWSNYMIIETSDL